MTLNKLTTDHGDSYFITDKVSLRQRGFEKVTKFQWEESFKNEIPPNTFYDIKLPRRATAGSAGYDFFAPFFFSIAPGASKIVQTGIKVYMGQREKLSVFPRSGMGFKYFVRLANTVGIIDSDYYNNPESHGQILIKIRNEGDVTIEVTKGTAFAQGIFGEYFITDDDSPVSEERLGGLGSTG
jgi:dUTP pyrophosphatase